jgi:predicted HD phosphohydrolase
MLPGMRAAQQPTVSFTAMADGTKQDYELLDRREAQHTERLPDRLLAAVQALEHSITGYQVTRYEHSLQSATRALRDGRDEEYVVMALLHDIGDELAPHTHSEMTGAILRPFVRPELVWIASHHGAFQLHYYGHHYGMDPNIRDRWAGHEHYDACVEFCERYDQNCFDPAYASEPLQTFAPMVRRVCSEPRYLPDDYV